MPTNGDLTPDIKGMVMKFWHIQYPLFDTPTDGSGGGTGTPASGTPASGTPASGTPAAPASGTPSGTPAAGDGTPRPGAQSGANAFTYAEDRSNWIPKHRFDEVNTRAGKVGTLEQALATERARVAALSGVTPPDPNAAATAEVQNAFRQMFPHLAKLDGPAIDRMLRLAEQSDQIETTTNHYWTNVGQQQMSALHARIAETMGGDLTDRQKQKISEYYVAALNRDHAKATSEGRQSEMLRRHENRDPKLIDEIAKEFEEDFFEPVRRRATTQQVRRVGVAVPGGRPTTTTPINSKPKIDFSNEQAVEDAAVAAFTAAGGMFKR